MASFFAKLHQQHRERRALLGVAPGFRHEKIEIRSSFQQTGALVRHRKILDQATQPGIVQRDHNLVADGFKHHHVVGSPGMRLTVHQNEEADVFCSVAQRQSQQRSRRHLRQGFANPL